MSRHTRHWIVAALAAAAVTLVCAQRAAATTKCTFSAAQLAVDMTQRGDGASLSVAADGTIVVSVGGLPIACDGAVPKVTTTKQIVAAGDPAAGANTVTISAPSRFVPGVDDEEPGGDGEVEFFVNFRGDPDSRVSLVTDPAGSRMRFGAEGINPNATTGERVPDADIFLDGVRNVTALGSTGTDRFSAQGGAGTGAALTDPIRLLGGDGNDRLIGGNGADDLDGGPGPDTIDARDGRRDTVDCRSELDTAIVDSADAATGCERVLLPPASRPSVRDETLLVSRANGPGGRAANGDSFVPSLSGDGRYVAFVSRAENLGARPLSVYVRDLRAGATRLIAAAANRPSISADGQAVAFVTEAGVSVRTTGTTLVAPNADDPSISGDGRYVAYVSNTQAYVRDLRTGTTTLASRASGVMGAAADGAAQNPAISANGRFVAFDSVAENLSDADTPGVVDVYVRDLVTNTTTLASRQTGADGLGGSGHSTVPSISADGRFVAFQSLASDLSTEDSDNVQEIFVRDLLANTTILASRGARVSDGWSQEPALSADGRFVAFESEANSFTPENRPGENIYLRDLRSRTITLVSRASGAAGVSAQGDSFRAALSGDARFVAFESGSTNLSLEDDPDVQDVFARDLRGEPVGSPAPRPVDASGPALSAQQLNRANRRVRVSRRGRFRLFCGRYTEPVTGTCRTKRFAAPAGRRVMVRFRLSRPALRKLARRGRLRLHGTVVARDLTGNATRVRFGFTLLGCGLRRSTTSTATSRRSMRCSRR